MSLKRAGKMRAPLLGLAKSIYYAGELVRRSPWFGRTCLLAYLTENSGYRMVSTQGVLKQLKKTPWAAMEDFPGK